MIVQEKIVESKQQKKQITEVCLFVTTSKVFGNFSFCDTKREVSSDRTLQYPSLMGSQSNPS